MADLYMREAQIMTLEAQLKALKFLRLGGGVVGLEGQGIATNPTTQDGESLSIDQVMESMNKMEETFMKPADVSENFFDGVFSEGLPDLKRVEEEANLGPQVREQAEKLLAVDESSDDETDSDDTETEGRDAEKKDVRVASGSGIPPLAEVEVQDSEEEVASDDGLVDHFVQVVKPTKLSKLHPGPSRPQAEGPWIDEATSKMRSQGRLC